jgi:WhiB family redox-sensing transcriptional regulator
MSAKFGTARGTRIRLGMASWGWMESAACRGEDLVLFFGPEGERQPERDIRESRAKAVCAGCPVRADCLSFAMSRPEKSGLWGGLGEEERHSERRRVMRRGDTSGWDAYQEPHEVHAAKNPIVVTEQRCTNCRKVKAAGEFNARPEKASGLASWCRDCQCADKKRRRDRNRAGSNSVATDAASEGLTPAEAVS